ncbi:hypothetical protein MM300_19125 [Evansella sp. LMS18]|uniref:hypothetical protein n=1 Tax=Evansella sp. LMS18 TaxID=2924033 RepID=UPI0020D0D9E4|nr:hypothetical protein [Evansella sp. LMS18]UTR09969.1 hypothetical protein MM300_19125 [Evansella sp. LMS18]
MIKNVIGWFQGLGSTETVYTAPFLMLFNQRFMTAHTPFASWGEFRNMGGSWLAEQPDEMLFLTEEWNMYVQENTNFSSWEAMLHKAEEQYIMEKPFGPYQMM